MEIKLHEITVKELTNGYVDNKESGVKGYGGKLDIRPPYQREFIYNPEQEAAVIRTVMRGFPLNVMYWATRNDGTFEIIDGQQRTISLCEYVAGNLSVNFHFTDKDKNVRAFFNLSEDQKRKILDYKLTIYQCTGEASEKLDWFKTINIAGVQLAEQELRNAVYSGPFISEAKKKFSKSNCVAYNMAKEYMDGSPIRQDYLETAIKWISGNKIQDYMSRHQLDQNADELWDYFESVINWVETTFPTYRKEMKGIDWGFLYNTFKDKELNPTELEAKIKDLMLDDDVTSKKGIYSYVLDGGEKFLNIRAFSEKMKREAYERQGGICTKCGKHFEADKMEADHITPWSQGGKTNSENCQMLCRECNRRKSDK